MRLLPLLLLIAASIRAEDRKPLDAAKLPPATKRSVDYLRDIKPILNKSCTSCHGPEKQRAGLRLDNRLDALKGGNSGPVLDPGHAERSRLLFIVAGLDADVSMPPKGKLTLEEVGHLRAWIDQGMRWPDEKITTGPVVKSSHWAFQPIARPIPPRVVGVQPPNPIDRFIVSRLDREGLTPAEEADRTTLIRRASLDLIGLPPTPAEVEAFVADARPDAYERLVDRLLSSPHYGERWGRHWLDVARYADTDGYEKDSARPFAWRWRNWVVEAINRDLTYDRFVVEQLAGDLLPGATTEQKTATGFHRNTLTNREGGVDQEQFRVEAVVDRVNTTAKVFLGITLGCAQCHDHKYDPLSQREYYRFFAFFNSDVESNIPAPTQVGNAEYGRLKIAHEEQRKKLVAAFEEEKRKYPPNLDMKEIKKRSAAFEQKLAAHDRTAPQPPQAQVLTMGKTRPTRIMIRGDFLRPGVEVTPGTPGVLPAMEGGTRLDLARWIVRDDNPLTARVAVNWVWQKYFGRGLVATLEDFGTQGEKPSHPELLDWLASEFMRRGWSMKELHRLIVTSATYRQSSKVKTETARRDPSNILLSRQSRLRLEAELLRDNALTVSGLLDRVVGGPSIRPPQPAGVAELSYAGSVKWVESLGRDRYRRGLYIWFQRTSPYPMLTTFDAPDGNLCCVKREKSNTPLQALTLLNDTVFVECAQALGKRILDEKPNAETTERVRHGFRLVLGRTPSEVESKRLSHLYEELLSLCRARPAEATKLVGAFRSSAATIPEAAAWTALARVLLNLDEVVTRE